jgi:ribosome-associated toxin RatA of RatAB toxin-antitoxin module
MRMMLVWMSLVASSNALAGEVLSETVPGSDTPAFVINATIDAPIEKVWAIVIDCADYKKNMPRISDSSRTGDITGPHQCMTVADLPFPLPDLRGVTQVTPTKTEKFWQRKWTLKEGDYEFNSGSWTLAPLADGKTAVTYRIHVKPKMMVPDGVMQGFTKKALPDMVTNLQERVRATP